MSLNYLFYLLVDQFFVYFARMATTTIHIKNFRTITFVLQAVVIIIIIRHLKEAENRTEQKICGHDSFVNILT